MVSSPLVVLHRHGEIQNPTLHSRLTRLAQDTKYSNVIAVASGSLNEGVINAMRVAEVYHGPCWFWLFDSRYEYNLPYNLSRTPANTLVSFSADTQGRDDVFSGYGGAYWLPSWSIVQNTKFKTWSQESSSLVDRSFEASKPAKDWPWTLEDSPFSASRLYSNSTFVLSYDEPQHLVEALLEDITTKVTPLVLPMKTDASIYASHRELAKCSETDCFLVFDADFKFDVGICPQDFLPEIYDEEKIYVHVWHVRNPINGLEYGHGGPKLFPKYAFCAEENKYPIDTTLSVGAGLTVHSTCVGTHAFNWSAFSTWRTAVREAAKLYVADDMVSAKRLQTWCNEADTSVPYADYCLAGANTGVNLAKQTVNIQWINDYAYLRRIFKASFPIL